MKQNMYIQTTKTNLNLKIETSTWGIHLTFVNKVERIVVLLRLFLLYYPSEKYEKKIGNLFNSQNEQK